MNAYLNMGVYYINRWVFINRWVIIIKWMLINKYANLQLADSTSGIST